MHKALDFSRCWASILSMLRAHGDLIAAVAGLFLFVPTILVGHLLPFTPPASEAGPQALLTAYQAYWSMNWLWLLISQLVSGFGTLVILVLVLRPAGLSVATAFTLSAGLYLPYLLASLLAGMAAGLGLMLLIVPGVYLLIKFSLVGAAMVAEDIANPMVAIKRSWQASKGNSLRMFGFFVVLFVTGMVLITVVQALLGSLVALVLPAAMAAFIDLVLSALLGTALSLVLIVAFAAMWRDLVGDPA